MKEPITEPAINTETLKAALEIVAILINVKKIAADRLLRPAGILDALIRRPIELPQMFCR